METVKRGGGGVGGYGNGREGEIVLNGRKEGSERGRKGMEKGR